MFSRGINKFSLVFAILTERRADDRSGNYASRLGLEADVSFSF
ncbi:hypothetical protein [Rhodococcus sp. 1168]|nr:hypothetical protein [Rhodococcus sp. 1168]